MIPGVSYSGVYETFVGEAMVHTYDNSGSFGELALMYNTARAATIQASTEGTLWALVSVDSIHIVVQVYMKERRVLQNRVRKEGGMRGEVSR